MDTNTKKSIKTILLLLEDEIVQRAILENIAHRDFGHNANVDICLAESTTTVKEEMAKYINQCPDANLYAIMDYNMGRNEPGDRKPTENLFFDKYFVNYLKNGGLIVIYSGYPEQVKQSSVILDANLKYKNLIVLLSEKSSVQMDDLFRLLKAIHSADIPKLKRIAQKYKYDLGQMIKTFKSKK